MSQWDEDKPHGRLSPASLARLKREVDFDLRAKERHEEALHRCFVAHQERKKESKAVLESLKDGYKRMEEKKREDEWEARFGNRDVGVIPMPWKE